MDGWASRNLKRLANVRKPNAEERSAKSNNLKYNDQSNGTVDRDDGVAGDVALDINVNDNQYQRCASDENASSLTTKLSAWYNKYNPERKCCDELLGILKTEIIRMAVIPQKACNDDSNENENINSMLQAIIDNQSILLEKVSKIEEDLKLLKADQNQTTVIMRQMAERNVHVGNNIDFPILNFDDLEKIDSLISTDPETYIAKIKTILRPGGIEKNFDRLFQDTVYLSLNYEGVQGKRGLKEFKALHDAIFESVKEEFLTFKAFKKEMQHCFKTFKNRHYSKKCREKKRKY